MSGFGAAGAPPAPTINGWQHLRTGKVRDLYTNSSGEILLVASDRISAFDWVLPTTIPNKGAILTQLSLFWFELLADIVPNHIITDEVPDEVVDRAVIVQPLDMFAVECVARGYLTGSGLVEYQQSQSICANPLPAGLLDGSKLPASIFTPAT
ncbi:MAG: phosphoribosylaminoimidazolesuccinocarboxamide synthase, partial [Candidatus Planktophila sp.]